MLFFTFHSVSHIKLDSGSPFHPPLNPLPSREGKSLELDYFMPHLYPPPSRGRKNKEGLSCGPE